MIIFIVHVKSRFLIQKFDVHLNIAISSTTKASVFWSQNTSLLAAHSRSVASHRLFYSVHLQRVGITWPATHFVHLISSFIQLSRTHALMNSRTYASSRARAHTRIHTNASTRLTTYVRVRACISAWASINLQRLLWSELSLWRHINIVPQQRTGVVLNHPPTFFTKRSSLSTCLPHSQCLAANYAPVQLTRS